MFNNVGGKIKACAMVLFVLQIIMGIISALAIGSAVGAIFRSESLMVFLDIILIIVFAIIAYVMTMFVYAFGDMAENLEQIKRNTYSGTPEHGKIPKTPAEVRNETPHNTGITTGNSASNKQNTGFKNEKIPEIEKDLPSKNHYSKKFNINRELRRRYEGMDTNELAEIYFSDDYLPEVTAAVKAILISRNVDFSTLKFALDNDADNDSLWDKYTILSDDELVDIVNSTDNRLYKETASEILDIRRDLNQLPWNCPSCGKENDANNKFCPHCGYLKPQQ